MEKVVLIRDIIFSKAMIGAYNEHKDKYPSRIKPFKVNLKTGDFRLSRMDDNLKLESEMPAITVNKYETDKGTFYKVIDGRHRTVVTALRGNRSIRAIVHV